MTPGTLALALPQAFYIPLAELPHWAQTHPEYSAHQVGDFAALQTWMGSCMGYRVLCMHACTDSSMHGQLQCVAWFAAPPGIGEETGLQPALPSTMDGQLQWGYAVRLGARRVHAPNTLLLLSHPQHPAAALCHRRLFGRCWR